MESYQHNTTGGYKDDAPVVAVANKRKVSGSHVLLRFAAVVMSLAAALVLGLAKQNTTVAVTLVPSLPPVNVPVTAKWTYLSAFVFFVMANAIACVHAVISLVLSLANKVGENKGIANLVVVGDLAMVALLFSSIGAAGGIGLMGYKGNSHLQWKKVCHVFDRFCHQGAAALGLSGAAAMAFFVLVVLATFNHHKKH